MGKVKSDRQMRKDLSASRALDRKEKERFNKSLANLTNVEKIELDISIIKSHIKLSEADLMKPSLHDNIAIFNKLKILKDNLKIKEEELVEEIKLLPPMIVFSKCLACKKKTNWPGMNRIPTRKTSPELFKCLSCQSPYLQFYKGKTNQKMKGGNNKMSEDETQTQDPATADEKPVRKKKEKKYNEEMKAQILQMAKDGTPLKEIVKSIGGPKAKAISRYCKAAGIEVTK